MIPLTAVELFDWPKLSRIAKRETYAAMYGSDRLLHERIDEEGCGAVICAARLVPD